MIDYFLIFNFIELFITLLLVLLSFLCVIYATLLKKKSFLMQKSLVKVLFLKKLSITDCVKLIKLTINKEINMNKINKIVGSVCISLLSLIGSANADSSAFTGLYVGVSGSAIGIAMDGKYNRTLGDAKSVSGSIGTVHESAGMEAGFSYPLSDMFFVTVGAGVTPFSSTIKANDALDEKNIILTTDDITTFFIEPSFNITENSAFFIKYGVSESEIAATGTEITNKVYDFDGETFGVGTKTVSDNGIYLKTEAGVTSYDTLTLNNIQEFNDGASTFTANAKADVDIAYGQITLGYKF